MKQLEENVTAGFELNQRYHKEIDKLNADLKAKKEATNEKNGMINEFYKKKGITDSIIKNIQTDQE